MPDDDLDPDPTDEPAPQEGHDLRRLREKAKTADDATARADAAERQLAFVKAGINPDDAQQGYFVRGYEGEVSADAIRAAATAAGFVGTGNTSEPQGMTEAERAAFAGTSAAAAATPAPETPTDIFADLRGIDPRRSGILPETFGMMIAERVEKAGGDVSFDGPQSGIQSRESTPNPRR